MLLCCLTLSFPTCPSTGGPLWRSYQHFDSSFNPSPLLPDMTLDDVRNYERQMHEKTNIKVCHEQQEHSTTNPSSLDDIEIHDKASVCVFFIVSLLPRPSSISYLNHLRLWMKLSQLHIQYIHSFCPTLSQKIAYMNCCICRDCKNKFPKGLQKYLGNRKQQMNTRNLNTQILLVFGFWTKKQHFFSIVLTLMFFFSGYACGSNNDLMLKTTVPAFFLLRNCQ